jgi:ATP-binding cassette subfamily B protein
VVAAGHTILENLSLEIPAGSHVAIVGPSGAGKSSLVGLLLGWHKPAQGTILVDESPLNGDFETLRRDTAWVDPAVQLWNRSLNENLRYGNSEDSGIPLKDAIDDADLRMVLERLPNGLESPLGEDGALVSGGEGQRIRLGRSLLRPGVRLVILDEAFRGLDWNQRHDLLARARNKWRDATLFYITHDVASTSSFDRVLILETGRIVEDGMPASLAKQSDSRYRGLLDAETAAQKLLWSNDAWQRLRLENGRVIAEERSGVS